MFDNAGFDNGVDAESKSLRITVTVIPPPSPSRSTTKLMTGPEFISYLRGQYAELVKKLRRIDHEQGNTLLQPKAYKTRRLRVSMQIPEPRA